MPFGAFFLYKYLNIKKGEEKMNRKILFKLVEMAEDKGISLEELDDEIYKERGYLAEIVAADCGEVSSDVLYRISEYLGADLNELQAEEIDTLYALEELSISEFLGKLKITRPYLLVFKI